MKDTAMQTLVRTNRYGNTRLRIKEQPTLRQRVRAEFIRRGEPAIASNVEAALDAISRSAAINKPFTVAKAVEFALFTQARK